MRSATPSRRAFLASVAALGIAPATSEAPPASEQKRKRGRHAVYVAELVAHFDPDGPADMPISFDGPVNVIDCSLRLKTATKRAHAFNRRQLQSGKPVREWAFVVAICKEVPEV